LSAERRACLPSIDPDHLRTQQSSDWDARSIDLDWLLGGGGHLAGEYHTPACERQGTWQYEIPSLKVQEGSTVTTCVEGGIFTP
jgi:hypothetical protein